MGGPRPKVPGLWQPTLLPRATSGHRDGGRVWTQVNFVFLCFRDFAQHHPILQCKFPAVVAGVVALNLSWELGGLGSRVLAVLHQSDLLWDIHSCTHLFTDSAYIGRVPGRKKIRKQTGCYNVFSNTDWAVGAQGTSAQPVHSVPITGSACLVCTGGLVSLL